MNWWLYDQSAIHALILGQVRESCVKTFDRTAIHAYSSVTGLLVLHQFKHSYGGNLYEALKNWCRDRRSIPFDLSQLGGPQYVDAFSQGPFDRDATAVHATATLLWVDGDAVTIVTADRTRYNIDPTRAAVFELDLKS